MRRIARRTNAAPDPVFESLSHSLRYITRTVFLPRELKERLRAMEREELIGLSEGLERVIKERKIEHEISGMVTTNSARVSIQGTYAIEISREYGDVYSLGVNSGGKRLLSNKIRYNGRGDIVPVDSTRL